MVGERAHRAVGYLWEIEGRACPDDHVDLAAAWIDDAKGSRLWLALFTLPTLVLAVEGAATDPQGILANGTRWLWCHDEAERISRDLMAWVKAHEKAPTAGTVSQPEEPETRAELADRLIVAAIDRLDVLALDLKPFHNIDDPEIFETDAKEKDSDGWDITKLTPRGAGGLGRITKSAVDALRATRELEYDSPPSAPEGWGDAMRQCLEFTFLLVPALQALERWADIGGEFFSEGEILTEFVAPARKAHADLAAAYAAHSPFPLEMEASS